jgi:hypothetical protein
VVQTSTPPAGWLKCKTSKGKPLVQQLNRRLQSSSISFEDESHDSLQTSGASNEEGHRDNRLTVETALKLYPADKDSSALSIRDGTSSNKGNRDSKLNRASGQSSARAESDSPRVTPEPPSEPAPQQRPKRRFSVSNLLSSVDMSSQMLQPGQKLWAVKQSHIKKAPASAQLLVGASSLTLFESAKTMRPLTSIQFGRIVSSKANTKRLLLRLQAPDEEVTLATADAKQIKALLTEQQHSFQQVLAGQENSEDKPQANMQLAKNPASAESAGEGSETPVGPSEDGDQDFVSSEDDYQPGDESGEDSQESEPWINPASTWVELEDEDGDRYYFDRASQQTSWNPPVEGVFSRVGVTLAAPSESNLVGGEEDWSDV